MRRTRGFTLIEMVIVVGILGILVALVVPSFVQSSSLAGMRSSSRKLVGSLARCRSLAASGKNENFPGWLASDRTVEAGLFLTPNGYQIFADRDRVTDGDEIVLEVVDYTDPGSNYHARVRLVGPPSELRFQRNGTLRGNANVNLVLNDIVSGQSQTITVNFGGSTRVN